MQVAQQEQSPGHLSSRFMQQIELAAGPGAVKEPELILVRNRCHVLFNLVSDPTQ